MEPPTEPLHTGESAPPVAKSKAVAEPPPPPPPTPINAPMGPFSRMHYRFTTGLRSGETAHVRDENGKVVLSYRAFASAAGIIATLVSGIVFVAGLAAVVFLYTRDAPLRAALALVLTLIFSFVIALLVPRVNLTLFDDGTPALTIAQRGVFPAATYIVAAPNGTTLAILRKSFLSRIGRNTWAITYEGRIIGEAREESFGRALIRKFLGKFSRRYEANVVIEHDSLDAGWIARRPDQQGVVDALTLTRDNIDRRVAVALATLILGREP